jgi:hypothetical protein
MKKFLAISRLDAQYSWDVLTRISAHDLIGR